PLAAHLDDLSTIAGEGMDAVFSHCKGYPAPLDRSPATRRKFLQDHSLKSSAVHINCRGRTVQQIHQEERLRRELNGYLDAADFDSQSPVEIKNQLVTFVRSRSDLAWALDLPEPPSLGWRLKELLHAVVYAFLVIILAPLWLLGLPIFLLLLRRHEKRDVADTSAASPEAVRALRDDEDYWSHNQIMAVG